jgi:hypothetical protein
MLISFISLKHQGKVKIEDMQQTDAEQHIIPGKPTEGRKHPAALRGNQQIPTACQQGAKRANCTCFYEDLRRQHRKKEGVP